LTEFAANSDKWVETLPSAIVMRAEVKGSIFGNTLETKTEALNRLPQTFVAMESMVESIQRFESFLTEMDAALQMGLSFKEWAALSPESEIPSDVTGLILLMPA
jgi:hypothetical protein